MYCAIFPLKLVLVLAIVAIGQSASATPAPPANSPAPATAATPRRTGSTESTRFWNFRSEGCMYNHGTNRCLDVEQDRKNWQSADAQLWSCNHNPAAQKLMVFGESIHSGYTIVAQDSARLWYCLDVPGGTTFEGQIVRWWQCNDSNAQLWQTRLDGRAYIDGTISPMGRPDLCLDPAGAEGGDRDGQPMILWRCSDRPIHRFRMAHFDSRACRS
ncbi:hypothetical protein BCR44DRAFT_1425601 [Catenaria anguillulae PL171]|uniref:Ricin B lectin domain-containing protein n=1 Tax=Catenaria anguillulae PL171 TaxID=765915 RepID=A0A1Y2HYS9_9FUNG|nr:hypothetical protein BCR44DRAFT_1425601 [Catenaria anguillulae PL171]